MARELHKMKKTQPLRTGKQSASLIREAQRPGTTAYTFMDLFSGAGGFTEGFLMAKTPLAEFRLIAASDLRETAHLTHKGRFSEQLGIDYDFVTGDMREDKIVAKLLHSAKVRTQDASIDVVCGGPPCQGFSVFGKREEKDPRNDLFRAYLRAIAKIRPKYFVMENVPGLVTMYGGKVPQLIHDEVRKIMGGDYEIVGPLHINAANYGVPQLRERVLFIGWQRGLPKIAEIPPTHGPDQYVTVQQAIGDLAFLRSWESSDRYLPEHSPSTSFQQDSRNGRLLQRLVHANQPGMLFNHEAARHTPEVIARFSMVEQGRGWDSIPMDLWTAHLHSDKKWCIRLSADRPSNTMTTLPDDFIHYRQHRMLTVREMARIQSFDDTFIFRGPRTTGGGGAGNKKRNQELPQYSQVGNAVPPLMARAIATQILAALETPAATDRGYREVL